MSLKMNLLLKRFLNIFPFTNFINVFFIKVFIK